MIIEPVYNAGKKLPYEIGFVGAKGASIDIEDYERAFMEHLDENIAVNNAVSKANLTTTVEKVHEVGDGVVKITLRTLAISVKDRAFPYGIETKFEVVMKNQRTDESIPEVQESTDEDFKVRPNQLSSMKPSEIINVLRKCFTREKKMKSLLTMVMKEMAKN